MSRPSCHNSFTRAPRLPRNTGPSADRDEEPLTGNDVLCHAARVPFVPRQHFVEAVAVGVGRGWACLGTRTRGALDRRAFSRSASDPTTRPGLLFAPKVLGTKKSGQRRSGRSCLFQAVWSSLPSCFPNENRRFWAEFGAFRPCCPRDESLRNWMVGDTGIESVASLLHGSRQISCSNASCPCAFSSYCRSNGLASPERIPPRASSISARNSFSIGPSR
jgi:hypothetical protein